MNRFVAIYASTYFLATTLPAEEGVGLGERDEQRLDVVFASANALVSFAIEQVSSWCSDARARS
jgi:hypothetical protein